MQQPPPLGMLHWMHSCTVTGTSGLGSSTPGRYIQYTIFHAKLDKGSTIYRNGNVDPELLLLAHSNGNKSGLVVQNCNGETTIILNGQPSAQCLYWIER